MHGPHKFPEFPKPFPEPATSRIPPIKIVKLAWKPRATTRKSAEGLVVVPEDGEVLQVQVTTSRSRTTMRTVQGLK